MCSVDFPFQSKLGGQTATMRTDDADGVRFVEKRTRAETLFQLDQLVQRSAIAIHAENRFRDNDDPRFGMLPPRPLQMALEFSGMVVRKNPDRRAAQSRPVDKRSMTKFVENHDILFRGQRGQRTERGGVAAAKANRRGRAVSILPAWFRARRAAIASH